MGKTIIVSNRLPLKISEGPEGLRMTPSEGGLATGLSSVHNKGNNLWIGWPGIIARDEHQKDTIHADLATKSLVPVFLSQEEITGYYEGFSNEVLWPIFHYISTYSNYEPDNWEWYKRVNEKFRDIILEHVGPKDVIWIHDYQLLLLPRLLREALPDATIGFFQHIPFPSQELFRLIPWRNELLRGMLGADLLGFHTYDDVRHFMSAAIRIAGAHQQANKLEYEGRTVYVESFPIGMDAKKFAALPQTPDVQKRFNRLKNAFSKQRLMLSVDRLDYSKGILQRLQAYELLLEDRPDLRRKITLYMIVVPSRDNVPQYEDLKNKIDREVGRLNALFGTYNWQPVSYFYQSFPVAELSALYSLADVCLVTPMRDGMNLVCKEYVASRIDNTGVLVLSELAGASHQLVDAIIVNPNDLHEMKAAMEDALNMPEDEMEKRMSALRRVVERFDIHYWADSFFTKLNDIKLLQQASRTKRLDQKRSTEVIDRYLSAKKRLLLLDYDGTLVGFKREIDKASPDPELYKILERLTDDPKNTVIIISGRKIDSLGKWFGHLPLGLVAEHGVWSKNKNESWKLKSGLSTHWQDEVDELLMAFADRTPGAMVERKSHSIAWHYRKVHKDLGLIRCSELIESLRDFSASYGLQILEGHKVIEVRNAEVSKGRSVANILHQHNYDYIFAAGDDRTDEDTFLALPDDAITIKVGNANSHAKLFVKHYDEVRRLLAQFGKTSLPTKQSEIKADLIS